MSNLYQFDGNEWVEIAKDGRDAFVDYDFILSKIPKPKNGEDGKDAILPKDLKEKLNRIPELERMAQLNAVPVTTSFFNGLRAKNLNIVGGTASQVGDTVNITVGSSGGASPLTTKGDIFGHSTVDARIPVGSDTQVLTADSTQALGVKWAPATVGGFAPISPTSGAINDTNKTFVFASAPTLIVINGSSYESSSTIGGVAVWTIAGTTVTLANPVGTGGDIYGLALSGTPLGGTVSTFSFTNASGISGTVTNPSTTPNLTLNLGDITPNSINVHNSFTVDSSGLVSGGGNGWHVNAAGNDFELGDGGVTSDGENMFIEGTLTVNGGSDPPYVTYFNNSRSEVVAASRMNTPPSVADGMIEFYNGSTNRFEWFQPLTGIFYVQSYNPKTDDMYMKQIDQVTDGLPCYNTNYKEVSRWNKTLGKVTVRQVPVVDKTEQPDNIDIPEPVIVQGQPIPTDIPVLQSIQPVNVQPVDNQTQL